jgi:hypothetical protein
VRQKFFLSASGSGLLGGRLVVAPRRTAWQGKIAQAAAPEAKTLVELEKLEEADTAAAGHAAHDGSVGASRQMEDGSCFGPLVLMISAMFQIFTTFPALSGL